MYTIWAEMETTGFATVRTRTYPYPHLSNASLITRAIVSQ